ncbi:inorganic pyrophosphatase [Fulvivirgaceae bacterium BMA12]|uniref:inorganic diphosphatase n=1 Tax=Agaribacillus aureus TaxID=3051825 RepID=A0ABT8LGX2_9BACT|nr:inorganic pyrophosphatase [Fulvivirgaceae bacterium BMA12]
MSLRYKSHPWHGIDIGTDAPEEINVFIEIVSSDTVKYEIDKVSGYLKIDRPQKFSNVCPALYGFIPRTYCGEIVASYAGQKAGIANLKGDGDPLDICVLTEKDIPRGDLLLKAIPIGGLRMIDQEEADDKIIAVLKDDLMYGQYDDLLTCPQSIVNRLKHYFLTYKNVPGEEAVKCHISAVYGKEEAHLVINKSQEDYIKRFGHMEEMIFDALFDV